MEELPDWSHKWALVSLKTANTVIKISAVPPQVAGVTHTGSFAEGDRKWFIPENQKYLFWVQAKDDSDSYTSWCCHQQFPVDLQPHHSTMVQTASSKTTGWWSVNPFWNDRNPNANVNISYWKGAIWGFFAKGKILYSMVGWACDNDWEQMHASGVGGGWLPSMTASRGLPRKEAEENFANVDPWPSNVNRSMYIESKNLQCKNGQSLVWTQIVLWLWGRKIRLGKRTQI